MSKLKICKCSCHEYGTIGCMDCQCCRFHDVWYLHKGKIDEDFIEKYATMVAEDAVKIYRERNKYFANEIDLNDKNPKTQNMVDLDRLGNEGFNRYARKEEHKENWFE